MNALELIAAAMYAAPDPCDPDETVSAWPPSHPDDLAWWLSRAQAAVDVLKEL